MKKRMITAVLIIALLVVGVFVASAAGEGALDPNAISGVVLDFAAGNNPTCPYCGVQPDGGWTALDSDISQWQRLNGHYYLTGDRTNTSYYGVVGGSACVYFGDCNITSDVFAFQVEGGVLTLMGKDGTVTGNYNVTNAVGCAIDVVGGTLNLCGGTYKKGLPNDCALLTIRKAGSIVNMYEGTVLAEGNAWDNHGGNVRLSADATFNMYGGEISAGQATCGGNIALKSDGAVFNMYGGSVIDGKAQLSGGSLSDAEKDLYALGGNIYVEKGQLIQHKGAAITGGSAYTGGNIYYDAGNTAQLAGTVSGGSGYTAGNIDLRGNSTMILQSGALISGGEARYDGGNIWVYQATLELDGGNITGGKAGRWGGSILADDEDAAVIVRSGKISGGESTGGHGGNICVDNGAKLQLLGGTVTGGKAMNVDSGKGGNIYIGNAEVQINNTAISMGEAYISGGNVHVQECTNNIAVEASQITYGTAAAGGNIYTYKTNLQLDAETTLSNGVSRWPTGSSFAGGGGNLFCQGGEIKINGQITDGEANLTGGNIEIRSATVYVQNGAVVSGGTANYDGGNINNDGVLVITDGTVSGGTAGRNGKNICSGGTVVLEFTAIAEDNGGVYLGSDGKLKVYASFDGRVAVGGLEIPEPVYGVTLDERFTSTGTFPGHIWIAEMQDSPELFGKDKKLIIGACYTVKDGVKSWYPDNATAVANYGEADYLVPNGDLVLTGGNYVVDLAGQDLNITGSGRVVCFDSSNDTFKTCGSARVDGPVLKNEVVQTVVGKHYVRMRSNGVYTFHRMDLKVSDVSLRVGSGGIYYSAQWVCDDSVIPLIQGFGIGVSVANMPAENLRYDSDTEHTYHSRSEFVSGIKTNGVLIQNILRDNASADRVAKNSTYAKMPIYAKAYVILDNGVDREQTVVSNDNIAISLHDVLQNIERNMPHYYSAAKSLQNFKDYWAQNGLTGEEWDFDFTVPVELLQLQQTYDETQQLTGQLHDRVSGEADLQAWKQQMDTTGIDFVSCLENGQVKYISGENWDSASFIGGVEAQFTVDGKKVDANLLFASLEEMEAVLTSGNGFTYSNGAITTKTLTGDGFANLIEQVRGAGGVVLMAHPKEQGLIESPDAMDYWFADGMAIDVFAGDAFEQNYKLWTDLLTEGKRVWAAASNAGAPNGKANVLTVYAAEKSAQQIQARLISGDYACGSIGMQMAVGNAHMGASGSFAEQKLALIVDEATPGVLKNGHTYRVDLITKTGVKESWPYNGRAVMKVMDADVNQAFYRLEVVDETTGQRIALGNPVWNEEYGLKVGFDRQEITPKGYNALIVGGEQRNGSDKLADDDGIFLTCVAMQEGDQTYLVYTADLINASSNYYTDTLKGEVARATGIPKGNIRFSTTHTHSSVGANNPSWSLLGENGETNRQKFLKELNEAAVSTAQNAIADLTEVSAAYTGSVTGKKDVAFVRHYVKTDGTLDYSNEGGYDEDNCNGSISHRYNWRLVCQYDSHAKEADNEIQLVKFQRTGDKDDVVLMSVPAHATLNENESYFSADFPNYARRYIESKTDSLVACFIGAAGDQVPKSKLCDYQLNKTMGLENNTDAKEYGEKLGKYAVAVLNGNMTQLRSTAMKLTSAVYYGTISDRHLDEATYQKALDFVDQYNAATTKKERTEINAATKKAGFDSYDDVRYTVYRYERVYKDPSNPNYDMNINIKTMAIGDLGFVFAPYEMAGVNGTQIKNGAPYATTFIATCSDDGIGYVASEDAFTNHSYEAQCTWFEQGSGELLAKRFIEVLQQQKYNLN